LEVTVKKSAISVTPASHRVIRRTKPIPQFSGDRSGDEQSPEGHQRPRFAGAKYLLQEFYDSGFVKIFQNVGQVQFRDGARFLFGKMIVKTAGHQIQTVKTTANDLEVLSPQVRMGVLQRSVSACEDVLKKVIAGDRNRCQTVLGTSEQTISDIVLFDLLKTRGLAS
jgi:hypothetical protein